MTFKECLESDIHSTFLNPEEFSDIHVINGREMPCQMDEIEQINREKRMFAYADGMYVNQKLIYVAASDYGALPKFGSIVLLDGMRYLVADAIDEGGVYSITLEANRA